MPSTADVSTKLDRVSRRVSALEGRSIPPDAMPVAIAALAVGIVLGGAGIVIGLWARRAGSEI